MGTRGQSGVRHALEGVPVDATVVGQTWKYVNKKGTPDKRFKDNKQLPVALYEEVHLTSATGLNEVLQVSRTGAGKALESARQAMLPDATNCDARHVRSTAYCVAPACVSNRRKASGQKSTYPLLYPRQGPSQGQRRKGRCPLFSHSMPDLERRRALP